MNAASRSHRSPLAVVAWVTVLLLGGGLIGASLMHLLAPPPRNDAAPTFATVMAREGTLERVISLNAALRWAEEPAQLWTGQGVLTERLHVDGTLAVSGDVVATVDLVPVTVAAGTVPMFRVLEPGREGQDVRQLQQMLVAKELLPAANVDGRFGSSTSQAVRAWRKQLGLLPSSRVSPSDLIFLKTLPVRIAFEPNLAVGSRLSDGTPFLRPLSTLSASIALPEGQARLVSAGQRVTLDPAGKRLEAVVSDIVVNTDAQGSHLSATLKPVGDGDLCGDQCDQIRPGEGVLWTAEVEVLPPTSGTIVPASAVTSDAAGNLAVVGSEGQIHPVTVIASAQGEVVVTGIGAGTTVRAPALLPREPDG